MKSLFAKILGLCFLVILTSLFANGYIRLFTMGMDKPHRHAFATLLTVEMDEARQSWEAGGKPALAGTVARLQNITKFSNAVLTDANGIDLLTGQNRHDLVNNAVNRSRFGYSGGGPDSFARVSPDHRYWLFVMGAKSLIAPLEWQYRLFAMGLAAIPCYVLSVVIASAAALAPRHAQVWRWRPFRESRPSPAGRFRRRCPRIQQNGGPDSDADGRRTAIAA